jgi:hypothetical protein
MDPDELGRLAELIGRRLAGRSRDLRLLRREGGIVLQGRACCYYAKQLAQHEVLKATNAPRLINEIEVLRSTSE